DAAADRGGDVSLLEIKRPGGDDREIAGLQIAFAEAVAPVQEDRLDALLGDAGLVAGRVEDDLRLGRRVFSLVFSYVFSGADAGELPCEVGRKIDDGVAQAKCNVSLALTSYVVERL